MSTHANSCMSICQERCCNCILHYEELIGKNNNSHFEIPRAVKIYFNWLSNARIPKNPPF